MQVILIKRTKFFTKPENETYLLHPATQLAILRFTGIAQDKLPSWIDLRQSLAERLKSQGEDWERILKGLLGNINGSNE